MQRESTVGQCLAGHRFYSYTVTGGKLKQLSKAKIVSSLIKEITMLRVKIKDILASSRPNIRVVIDTLNTPVLLSLNEGAYFHPFRACSYSRGEDFQYPLTVSFHCHPYILNHDPPKNSYVVT
jgi:hypothetical protein